MHSLPVTKTQIETRETSSSTHPPKSIKVSPAKQNMIVTAEEVEGSGEPVLIPPVYEKTCLHQNSDQDSILLLASQVFRNLSKKQVKGDVWSPTPVQLVCWPILKQSNCNLITIAPTGSGKTLGYVIPMIDSCMAADRQPYRSSIHSLVIVPTRELAIQVSKTMKAVSKVANKLRKQNHVKISAIAIYGGIDRKEQMESLLRNNNETDERSIFVLATTPMRLIDLLKLEEISDLDLESKAARNLFEFTQMIVFDEADRCAIASDISKQCDIILSFVEETSKNLIKRCFFSATLPQKSLSKCDEWIMKPRAIIKVDTVTVGREKEKGYEIENHPSQESHEKIDKDTRGTLDLSLIPKHITQILHVCANHKKPKKLLNTIRKIRESEKNEPNRRRKGLIIVFFGRIKTLEYIFQLCNNENVACVTFHSKMSQEKRETQLNLFRCGKIPILLATDIAARGIHCNNVEYIVNYDFPGSLEQYVHRCGRSGRNQIYDDSGSEEMSMKSTVYSFFHRELAPLARDMVDLLRSNGEWIDPNLIQLIPKDSNSEYHEDKHESRRKRRKRNKETIENATSHQFEDDEFANLGHDKIMLQRASHVAIDSSDEE